MNSLYQQKIKFYKLIINKIKKLKGNHQHEIKDEIQFKFIDIEQLL